MMHFKQLMLALPVLLSGTFVLADGSADYDDDEGETELALGLLVSSDPSLYLDGKDEVMVFPFIQARWKRLFWEGPSLGAYLYENNGLEIKAALSLDGIGDTDRDDSPRLADMQSIDNAFLGQLEASYEAEWGEFSVALAADISNEHDGYKAELSYAYPLQWGRWQIEPSIEVEWFSKEISQHYYGVTLPDVRADRPFYEPDAGFNYGVGLMAMYPFKERHAIILNAKYTMYSSEISDSPIVDEDKLIEFGIGYVYRF